MKKIINLNLLSLSRPTCKSAIFNSLIGLICCFFSLLVYRTPS